MSIKIENTQVFGWEAAIKGSRNPMNSWEKSDSWFETSYNAEKNIFTAHAINRDEGKNFDENSDENEFLYLYRVAIGPNDHKLLMNLCKGGTEESKWRRMIHVQMDVTAPLYWWKEFETYKIATVSNSCSTMHKIHAKEFTLDDFSHEHLGHNLFEEELALPESQQYLGTGFGGESGHITYPLDILRMTIDCLNAEREKFLETKDKKYWYQMIQLLPSSYNQRRTIDLNYEVLASQYRQRKDHKLQEWLDYCSFIKSLPYSEFITLEDENEK